MQVPSKSSTAKSGRACSSTRFLIASWSEAVPSMSKKSAALENDLLPPAA
jgi:hypothetical protein